MENQPNNHSDPNNIRAGSDIQMSTDINDEEEEE